MVGAFSKALRVSDSEVKDGIKYGTRKWDSIAHMVLVGALESEFNIMIDTEDVIAMSSFDKAKEIVTKYGVDLKS